LVQYLLDIGIPIERTGTLDFNADGIVDYWIVERKDAYNPSLSIILDHQAFYQVIGLGSSFVNGPETFTILPPFQGNPSFKVADSQLARIYSFRKSPPGEAPDLGHVCYTAGDAISNVEKLIFSETPRLDLLASIDQLSPLIRDTCDKNYVQWYMPKWHYFMAVLNEHLGRWEMAFSHYAEIVKQYPDSPFALIAEARITTSE
jgi:hypothetical protein